MEKGKKLKKVYVKRASTFDPALKPMRDEGKKDEIDIFAEAAKGIAKASGVDRVQHEASILVTEWAIRGDGKTPHQFLDSRGYSDHQIRAIFKIMPAPDWHSKRELLQNQVTETVVKRHVDLIAEVQETHIKASKLGLAKAIELMSKGQQWKQNGKPVLDKDGNPIKVDLTPAGLLDCMSSVEKAQQIYRRAMGLPNEEAGLKQVLDAVATISGPTNIQNNLNVTINQDPERKEFEEKVSKLTYDDVIELIRHKREMKRKLLDGEVISDKDAAGDSLT
jgi:hypothetical protein